MSVLVFYGAPGSGKGTQSKLFVENDFYQHISTGDIIRASIANHANDPVASEVKKVVDSGKLVSDGLIYDLLDNHLKNLNHVDKLIFDGFPRNKNQFDIFQQLVDQHNLANVVGVLVNVNDDTIIKRLTGRIICTKCKAVYNKYFNKPANNSCSNCGNDEFVTRSDDTEAVIRDRINLFNQETKPTLAKFAHLYKYHAVNGEQEPKLIYQEISRKLTIDNQLKNH
jgi:adenylate kinase